MRCGGFCNVINRHPWPIGASRTPFARGAVERITAELPKLGELPVYADDLARPDVCSFGRFAFFVSSRRRHTRSLCDWSSDVCSSDLPVTEDIANLVVAQLIHLESEDPDKD